MTSHNQTVGSHEQTLLTHDQLYDADFARPVWEELSRLRTEKVMCDVIFVAMDQTHIHAHGCVLAACSRYLKQTLSSHAGRPGFCIELPCLTRAAIDSMLHFVYTGHLKLHASEINSVKVTAKALQIESLFKACTMLSERRQAISEVNNSRHPVNVCSLKNPNHCKDTLKDASQVSRENYKECQSDSSANRCDIGLCEKESNQTLSQEEGSFETKTTYTISGHSGVVLTDKIEKVNNINTTEYNNTNMDTCENDRESRRYSNGVKNKLKNISSSLDVPMETEQAFDPSKMEDAMASENNEDFPNVENKSVKPEDAQKTDESIEELTGSDENSPKLPQNVDISCLQSSKDSSLSDPNLVMSKQSADSRSTETLGLDTSLDAYDSSSNIQASSVNDQSSSSVVQDSSSDIRHSLLEINVDSANVQYNPSTVNYSPPDIHISRSSVQGTSLNLQASSFDVQGSPSDIQVSSLIVSDVKDKSLDVHVSSSVVSEDIGVKVTSQLQVKDRPPDISSGSSTDQILEDESPVIDVHSETDDSLPIQQEPAHTGLITENAVLPDETRKEEDVEISYRGEMTEDRLLFTEEVAMETDVVDDLTFAEVIGSETIVEVASGYNIKTGEVEGGCHGQQETVAPLMACESLSVVKEEEWMAESRSEELVDNTTQYVAVELKVESEGEGQSSRTALVTIPVGQDGVVEKEALQAMFNQTALPEQEKDTGMALPYRCELCDARFTSLQELRQHIVKTKHQSVPGFVCTECGQTFKYKHNLKNHQLRHLEVKPFVCKHEKCKKQFASKNDLIVHSRCHTGTRPYVCDYCSKAFTQSSNLLTHKRSVHNQEFLGGARNFSCPECHKTFKTKDMMHKHMKRHLLAFTCSQCDMKFRTRKDLKTHGLDTHNIQDFLPAREDGERVELYQCPQCEKVYMDTTRLHEHITIVHNKEKRFSCPWDGCQYTAYYKYNIQRHYKVHETGNQLKVDKGVLYRCQHCTAPFTSLSGMKVHLKSVHGKDSSQEESVTSTEGEFSVIVKEEQNAPEQDSDSYSKNSHDKNGFHSEWTGSTDQSASHEMKTDTNKAIQEKHSGVTHQRKDVYICKECTETFTQRLQLQKHQATCHTQTAT